MGICCTTPKIISATSDKPHFQTLSNVRLSTIKPHILKHQNSLSQNNLSHKLKTENEISLIVKALRSHFVFSNLSDIELKEVAGKTQFYVYSSNEHIFKQGQVGNNFYIINSGRAEVQVNEKKVALLKSGSTFGELAILHSTTRTATVTALTKVELWGLHRKEFLEIVKFISSNNFEEIQGFIEKVEMFSCLTKVQKLKLSGSFVVLKYNQGFKIFKEGEEPESLYIIESGKVCCSLNDGCNKVLSRGDHFGDKSLNQSFSSAAVTALEPVRCLAISKSKIAKILGNDLQTILLHNKMRQKLKIHTFFSEISSDLLDSLSFSFKFKTLQHGNLLFSAGKYENEIFSVVLNGKIAGSQTLKDFGNFIGDFESTKIFEEDLLSQGESVVGFFSRKDFERVCGCEFWVFRNNLFVVNVLKNLQIFKHVPEESLIELSKSVHEKNYQSGEVILKENSIGESVYILVNGKVDIFRGSSLIRTLTKHDYFGERGFINNLSRTATVKSKGNTTCWVISNDDFSRIYDENIMKCFQKRINLQDEETLLIDLLGIQSLGHGAFGNVFLVMHKATKALFALKVIEKKIILSFEIEENVITERNILRSLDHEFIMKLIKSFKDSEKVYFLLEYVAGITLFEVSNKLSAFSTEDCKFYASCLILALTYMHEREVVYRDLKPENILIDSEGYPKLIDFGTAKVIQDRTFTVLGTPHYMAPEIILFKGYSFEVDYWALGVVLYECLFGVLPFGHDKDDPYEIFQCILEKTLKFPDVRSDLNARAFIAQLLSQTPGERVVGGIDKLIKHPWFGDVNCLEILSRAVKPPFVPDRIDVQEGYACDLAEFISKQSRDCPVLRTRTKEITEDWDESI